MKLKFVAALLAGSAMSLSAPTYAAQDPAAAQPEQTEPDTSDATADAAIEQVKAGMVKATPSWKGAPQWEDKDAGFSFKPKGLVQFDAGYTGFPKGNELRGTVGGLNFGNLGWNSR